MISAQIEDLVDHLPEIQPLLPIHWKELALNQERVPLDPEYETYIRAAQKGEIVYVTLRDNGILVGYVIYFVRPGLHYRTCLTAIMDILYVHPDHRGNGGGLKLLDCSERELRRRGVKNWIMGNKKKNPKLSELLRQLGFEPIEDIHAKWIGD